MHILLLSHYFPPESNAPANRGSDHARRWIERGCKVTVVTTAPSHPRGVVYPGYRNRLYQRAVQDGVDVIRLGTWLAPNSGALGRIVNFLSFFVAVFLWQWRFPKADIVLSTSPQFFCGLAGWLLKRKHRPWVLEIRDLWPESIVAVGAMRRNLGIRFVEWLESFAYRKADLIVSVTESFVPHIAVRSEGTPTIIVRNGVVPGALSANPAEVAAFRRQHGLDGRFVAAFVGTHGMAHGLGTIFDAAERLKQRDDIAFLLVGDGAERDRLVAERDRRQLANVVMLPQQPRSAIPVIWGASDAALVLLKDSSTFRSVLPTKMFEAMAASTAVILGVAGEAQAMLETADGGIAIPPESVDGLVAALERMADNPAETEAMGRNGHAYFEVNLDRTVLADTLLDAMKALKR